MSKKETRVQQLPLRSDKSGDFVECCGQRIHIQTDRNACGTCGALVDKEGWQLELIDDGKGSEGKAPGGMALDKSETELMCGRCGKPAVRKRIETLSSGFTVVWYQCENEHRFCFREANEAEQNTVSKYAKAGK